MLALVLHAYTVTSMDRAKRKANGQLNGSLPKPAPVNKKPCAVKTCSSVRLYKHTVVCRKHFATANWGAKQPETTRSVDLSGVAEALDLGVVVVRNKTCSVPKCREESKDKGSLCKQHYNESLNDSLEFDVSQGMDDADNQVDFFLTKLGSENNWAVTAFRTFEDSIYRTQPEMLDIVSRDAESMLLLPQSRGRINMTCTPDEGEPHDYDGRISMLYSRVQVNSGNQRMCESHQHGAGGYNQSKPGYLYFLRRPSMVDGEVVTKDGVTQWDYQFGISNHPRNRLRDHINRSSWEVVQMYGLEDGSVAHKVEAALKKARGMRALDYFALDHHGRVMSGNTESFKQEDFGKEVNNLRQLVLWAEKVTGDSTVGEAFRSMNRVPKKELDIATRDGRQD